MSLIDDLRASTPAVPPSHKPTVNEVIDLLGAWIAYAEYGVEFLAAAKEGQAAVAQLFADKQQSDVEPPTPVHDAEGAQPPAPEPAPSPAPAPSVSELEQRVAALTAQLAAAKGVADLSPATVEPVVEGALA